MNIKESNTILLILCGFAGMSIISLVPRYICIEAGIDAFGANIVFGSVFVVGMVLYISFLDFMQKTVSLKITRLFNKKGLKDNTTTIDSVKTNLEEIRHEHSEREENTQSEKLQIALDYTNTIFAPYADDSNILRLCSYVESYYNGEELSEIIPIRTVDLQNPDIFHFGWNIWNHFRISKQNKITTFLKTVFAHNLKTTDIETIYKKLRTDEKSVIKLQDRLRE